MRREKGPNSPNCPNSKTGVFTPSNSPNSPNSSLNLNKEPFRGKLAPSEADSIMESVSDLVTEKYRPRYFKKLYEIGPDQFVRLAIRSREGKVPSFLFRHLLFEDSKRN